MSQDTSEQAVHQGRPGSRASAVDPTPGNMVFEVIRHARAADALAAEGDDVLALGAKRVAAWLALRLATTPPRTELEHDVVLSGLELFLLDLDDDHHIYLASLLQTATWAQAERRIRMGLRPYGFTSESGRDGEGRATASEEGLSPSSTGVSCRTTWRATRRRPSLT